MKKRLLAWLLSLAMLLTVGAVAAAETNPNAGLGYYPGTSEKGWISVECSTMSKMNPFLQTYSTEFSVSRHIWDCLVKLSAEDNSIVPAAAESWEKKIGTLTLFVFDGSGDAVLQRNFTAAEISGQTATIPVPDAAPGQTYSFYAIANGSALSGIGTLDDLRSQTESEIADYNGTFDEVTTKAKRSAGFTMTGSATQVIAQAGQTTTVQIALERLVSKVAVQATTDSKFASAYPGRVRIASATVSRAASSVFYFDVGTSHSGGTQNREYSGETMPLSAAQTFSHTQAAKEQSGKYANLFYIYGNEDDKAAESVLLTLEGIYDHDGDFGTTDDQMPVSYEIELAGDSGKAINRNTYRRVTVNISGLMGADVAVTITPADWEGPFNQDVNIGM